MYQHLQTPVGDFMRHTFKNTASGNSFSVVAEQGATLTDLTFMYNGEPHHLIAGYDKADALIAYKGSRSAWLLPFPNRLKGGQYTFEGQTYQFPIHEDKNGRQNTLHGFRKPRRFELLDSVTSESSASATFGYDYDGRESYYPFAFRVAITYTIGDTDRTLDIKIELENTGSGNMPIGLGWHPYFQFSNKNNPTNVHDRIDKVGIQLPRVQRVAVDGHQIPTGALEDFDDYNTESVPGLREYDDCFKLVDTSEGRAHTLFKYDTVYMRLWQQTGEGGFNYLQMYTPEDRLSIAVEPMTCNINALQNGNGLIVLSAGQKHTLECGIDVNAVGYEDDLMESRA